MVIPSILLSFLGCILHPFSVSLYLQHPQPLPVTLSIAMAILTGWGFTHLWPDGSWALTFQDVKLSSVRLLHLKLMSQTQPPPNCNNSFFPTSGMASLHTLPFFIPLLCPPYWTGPQIRAGLLQTHLSTHLFRFWCISSVQTYMIYLGYCTT